MWKPLMIGINVVIWYTSSVGCAVLSKHLLREGLPSDVLTLFQLTIGFSIARATLFIRRKNIYKLSNQMNRYMLSLAIAFAVGFKTLNAALGVMAVASCMTLRVTEPIFTWVITKILALLSYIAHPSKSLLLPILFIVAGAILAVWSSAEVNVFGVCAVFSSNTCFASRSIITKKVQQERNMDPFLIFYHICKFGVLVQLGLLIGKAIFWSPPAFPHINILYLIANGATWYVYLQFSTIVNVMVNAITHTTINAMRQTVVITASAVIMGYKLSLLNEIGIGIATTGSLMYSWCRHSSKPLVKRISDEVELGYKKTRDPCDEVEDLLERSSGGEDQP